MQTVGDYLKKERVAKNISLREVARLTKISMFYLDYLEKNDYEKLPQGPYIKGYISSYARLIGCNPDEALRLYDSLREQKNQTEAIQPEISKDKGWLASIASSLKSIVSSFPSPKTIIAPVKAITALLRIRGSSLKAAIPSSDRIVSSLKAAGASIKTIAPSIKKAGFSLKTISPAFKKATAALNANRLFNAKTWLYTCFVLLSSTILVLAGFGFYHLFVYQENPFPVADVEVLQDKGSKTTFAMSAERNVLTSRSNDVSAPSDQAEEFVKNKGRFPLPDTPASGESLSPLPSNSAAGVSRETSGSESLGKPSGSAAKTSTPASKTASPAETTPSGGITAGRQIGAQSRERQISASLSAESTSTFASLNVLKATICADIEDRMPAGVGNTFSWSTNRVYVWNLVQAKDLPSEIRHIYYREGEKVTDVALKVRSSHWRTWSYKTISNERYKGSWRVDIASAEGQVLRSLYFEIN